MGKRKAPGYRGPMPSKKQTKKQDIGKVRDRIERKLDPKTVIRIPREDIAKGMRKTHKGQRIALKKAGPTERERTTILHTDHGRIPIDDRQKWDTRNIDGAIKAYKAMCAGSRHDTETLGAKGKGPTPKQAKYRTIRAENLSKTAILNRSGLLGFKAKK